MQFYRRLLQWTQRNTESLLFKILNYYLQNYVVLKIARTANQETM